MKINKLSNEEMAVSPIYQYSPKIGYIVEEDKEMFDNEISHFVSKRPKKKKTKRFSEKREVKHDNCCK